MAKLAILAAVFGMLLVAATARTTMLSLEVDEEENQRGRCLDELERAQMLSHCQDFLEEVSRTGDSSQCYGGGGQYGPGSQYGGRGGRGMRGSWHLDACCDQLRQVDERCMCEGLRQIVRQQTGQTFGVRGSQQIAQCARQLPQICGSGRSCYQIRVPYDVGV
ncbi:2S albumin-like [Punica granatum]|uniref:Bifunctional inhibitor/plant lipid transfer protein/seed storage helical domain-containing protein n=2 Tax=Punica granatum TaxID=22663 RepID=A0A218XVS0_PUNGR|nr:2S albumin-like [Punica granatum]OWM88736.1 hypothetical protein CDL15_Pgr002503 [Punica granatum]PKI55882.1 hypothetical protein CRG98_023763 [Punica granatum]